MTVIAGHDPQSMTSWVHGHRIVIRGDNRGAGITLLHDIVFTELKSADGATPLITYVDKMTL